jgi:hypothetical protein
MWLGEGLALRRDEVALKGEAETKERYRRDTKHERKPLAAERKALSTGGAKPHRFSHRSTTPRTHCYIQTHLFSPTVTGQMINYIALKIQLCIGKLGVCIT